jgi:plastocyanin
LQSTGWRPGRRRGSGALPIALACALLLGAGEARAQSGEIRGSLSLQVEGISLADAGPIVVFLEGAGGRIPYEVPRRAARVQQKDAKFSPSFVVIAAGQRVEMPNDDIIFHNVFSYSRPNDFDLGLYPKGASRSVTLRHPGVVRFYCSIHESMSGIIFVAPSPYYAVVRASGAFGMEGVPPGRYRIRTWSEKLPEASRTIEVAPGEVRTVRLTVGEARESEPRAARN